MMACVSSRGLIRPSLSVSEMSSFCCYGETATGMLFRAKAHMVDLKFNSSYSVSKILMLRPCVSGGRVSMDWF